jgi:hypothetical protein
MNEKKKRLPKCGAKTRPGAKSPTCTRPAGWRTDHPGQGKCYLHGGKTPIKSGRYSLIKRHRLKDRIEQLRKDPDPLNLLPEIAFLRALVEDAANNLDEKNPDPSTLTSVGQMIDRVGAMADRVHKHRASQSISIETLNRIMEQAGVEAVAAIRETVGDETTRSNLLKALERRWSTLRLDAYTTAGPREAGSRDQTSGD